MIEENVDKKVQLFFEFGRRLKSKIIALKEREEAELAQMAADRSEKKPADSKNNQSMITGVDFWAVNK